MNEGVETLLETLRCPSCRWSLTYTEDGLPLHQLAISPILSSTGYHAFLLPSMRDALTGLQSAAAEPKQRKPKPPGALATNGIASRRCTSEWEKQFLNYMQPHAADFFPGKKILDAGCGNGRFAYYAAKYGGDVWAIDLGPAVEVARHNTESQNVHVVQADLYNPPFASRVLTSSIRSVCCITFRTRKQHFKICYGF